MHLEVIVEEPSARAALQNILPFLIGPAHSFRVLAFQDKGDMILNLPRRLRGYSHYHQTNFRIIVLLDEDRKDCRELKNQLEIETRNVGLISKTAARGGAFQVVNRIAVEELEAWFFGDIQALKAAFPRIPAALEYKAPYRVPDQIRGGTWEALHRVLRRAGYFPNFLPKIEVARRISLHMNPEFNRSHSFQVFRQGILACLM